MFEQLPRMSMRPDKDPDVEIEIWKPDWRCFCCHDSGIIVSHLVRMVIPEYNENTDKLPRCSNPKCQQGAHYDSEALSSSVDRRINSATCKKLDELERESWRQTVFVHWQRVQQQTQDLARGKSLTLRERTANDEREIQQRKQEIETWTQSETKWAQFE